MGTGVINSISNSVTFIRSVSLLTFAITAVGCSDMHFTPMPVAPASPVTPPPTTTTTPVTPSLPDPVVPTPVVNKAVAESFTQGNAGNQIDILIINDNSISMAPLQAKLASRFASLISSISDMDYHIGMTTTDLDSKKYNQGGRLLTWAGTATNVLTPSIPNASAVFSATVVRPETVNCDPVWGGDSCPSGNEQALLASMAAMMQKDTANAGFFREKTPLVLVILSNEDEQSTGAAGSATAQNVLDTFSQIFGSSKQLVTYSIIVKPGDAACLKEQRDASGDIFNSQQYSAYGTHAFELASRTGGQALSICAQDYSQPLAEASLSMRRLVTSYPLKTNPKNGNVKVTFTPSTKIGYHVEGRRLILDSAPPYGTKIVVEYEEN